MNKTISDVLEYLYKNKQKALADAVIRELQNNKQIIRETTVLPAREPMKVPQFQVWC